MKKRERSSGAKRLLVEVEAEVVPGLEQLATQEIQSVLQKTARLAPEAQQAPGVVRFMFSGDMQRLQRLRTVQAIYLLTRFSIPRPKALLGNENFQVVTRAIDAVIGMAPQDRFDTFHISAAGSDSSIMRRFAAEIAGATKLTEDLHQGDLWLRLRRSKETGDWELLVRLGNRPLATRDWRICNYEGALNATVAYAMIVLSEPTHDDSVINLGFGSGSLLIERAAWGRSGQLVGIDKESVALKCAAANIAAAATSVTLLQADLRSVPLAVGNFDVLLADLPFGQRSGSHRENQDLYPAALAEAGRIARRGARFVVITHEIRLMDAVVAASKQWVLIDVLPIILRGLHPRIYVLRRNEVT